MLILICALGCEASPLVKALALKKSNFLNPLQSFSGDGVELVISGVGSLKAASATAAAIGKAGAAHPLESILVINIGTCGSKNLNIGQAVLPHTITGSGKKTFFQELIVTHHFYECTLHSVEKPGEPYSTDCVDMEAYSVFHAASTFLKTSQCYTLKVVSDNCDKKRLEKETVSGLIKDRTEEILKFAASVHDLAAKEPLINNDSLELLTGLKNNLRLTAYQGESLKRTVTAYLASRKGDLEILKPFLTVRPADKAQAKRIFSEIQKTLNGR